MRSKTDSGEASIRIDSSLARLRIEALLLRRSSFVRYHRQSGVFPALPSAQKRSRVLDSVSIEIQHRTGACMLGLSRTVSNQELAAREVFVVRRELAERNADCARKVAFVERLFRTDVDVDRLFLLHHFHGVFARDPSCG